MPAARHDPQLKTQALAIYIEEGVAEATRQTGVNANTIKSWAKREGLQPMHQQTNSERTRAAVERRKRSLEERRAVLVEKLGELAELGVDWTTQALTDLDAESVNIRDAIGAFTRAIHDLQLLSGGATSRGEHRDLTNQDDVQRLRDELAERRERKQAL